MHRTRLSPFILLFRCAIFAQAQQCYHHNGTVTTDLYHEPCSNNTADALSSICCAIARPNAPGTFVKDGYVADKCLDNGLCQNTWRDENGSVGTTYWREECTSEDWTQGKCMNVCTGGTSGNVEMTPCDGTATSEQWCCGNSDSCCNGSGAVSIPATFGGIKASTPTAASSTSATTSQPTTTTSSLSGLPSATPAATAQSSSSGLSIGAKAGIAIGAIAGIALIFSAGYLIARRKHTVSGVHGQAVEKSAEPDGYYAPAGKDARSYVLASSEVQEMNGQMLHEAPDGQRWKSQELP